MLTQLSVDQVTVSLLTWPKEVQNRWRLPCPGTRAREHRSTCSLAHTREHRSSCTRTHTREHRSSHARMHTHESTEARSLSQTPTREHRSTRSHTHACARTHESTEALSLTHTHTQEHRSSLTHTHTHTHTHTLSLSLMRAQKRSLYHTHTHMHTPHFLPGSATDGCLGPRWLDRLSQMAAWGWQPGPDPGPLSPDPPIPSVTCFRATGGSSWDGCLCALGHFQGPARPLPKPHRPLPPIPSHCLAPVHCGAWQVLLGTSARPAPSLAPACVSVCPSVTLALVSRTCLSVLPTTRPSLLLTHLDVCWERD